MKKVIFMMGAIALGMITAIPQTSFATTGNQPISANLKEGGSITANNVMISPENVTYFQFPSAVWNYTFSPEFYVSSTQTVTFTTVQWSSSAYDYVFDPYVGYVLVDQYENEKTPVWTISGTVTNPAATGYFFNVPKGTYRLKVINKYSPIKPFTGNAYVTYQ